MGLKQDLARARMTRPRVYIGAGGATHGAVRALARAFGGYCLDGSPADVVKVRIQRSFVGDVGTVARLLGALAHCDLLAVEGGKTARAFAYYRRLP